MNKRLVGWILLCWLVGGLSFLFQIEGVREVVRQQVEGGWEIVHKFLGQRAPEWHDYPNFRASEERVRKGAFPSSTTHSAGSSHVSFLRPRIIDGDTIHSGGQRIRLSGIDAPERSQPYGTTVTRALAGQLHRGRVTCQLQGKDKYDRHLGTCYVQGRDMNKWMVRNGYAWSDPRTPRYRLQEELAQRERRGVHRSGSTLRPEQWRRRGRREKETDLPRRSIQSRMDERFVVSRREKETGLPGPSPRRSGPSGRDQPRRSSDTHAAGSSHISFFRPRIIDGDTIRHKRRKIRLNGIDAPERGQPYGSEAARALARKLRRGKVTCRLEGKDAYGRHLGTCYIKGKNVNEWMVRNGYAWSYWLSRYRRQEEAARRERKGVHRSRSAVRPEQWRRRRG